MNFSIEKSILGWKSTTGKPAFQSNFKFTYVQLTFMLHYRIHGFLCTQLSVRKAFQSKVFHLRAAMKTQCFANIWKASLAPFSPLNYVPIARSVATERGGMGGGEQGAMPPSAPPPPFNFLTKQGPTVSISNITK